MLVNKLTSVKEIKRDRKINREVFIKIDEDGPDTNLFDFCNSICKETCGESWDIEDGVGDFDCDDCSVGYMYRFGFKLCEMEHSKEGIKWAERLKVK